MYSDEKTLCKVCGKKYSIYWKKEHFPGAGSETDMSSRFSPCRHFSVDYDSNRTSPEFTEVSIVMADCNMCGITVDSDYLKDYHLCSQCGNGGLSRKVQILHCSKCNAIISYEKRRSTYDCSGCKSKKRSYHITEEIYVDTGSRQKAYGYEYCSKCHKKTDKEDFIPVCDSCLKAPLI